MLQVKNTDVNGRNRDRLTLVCHESPSMFAVCVGRKVKRYMSLGNEKQNRACEDVITIWNGRNALKLGHLLLNHERKPVAG